MYKGQFLAGSDKLHSFCVTVSGYYLGPISACICCDAGDGVWSRALLRDAGSSHCLRRICAWISKRETEGLSLKGTRRGIRSRAVSVELYPYYLPLLLGFVQVFYKHILPPCIAPSSEFMWVNCVFPSLLLATGWDQSGSVVCPVPFNLLISAFPQEESPSDPRGCFEAIREFLHLSQKPSPLLQVLQVR